MAGLLDLFGGGGGSADDPYADILTPAQRQQMQTQGLLAMAGAFAEAGMPSRLPIPFGAALGKAAAALGTGQEAGMKAAIENALAAQKVRDLRSTAEFRKKTLGDLDSTSPLGRAINQILYPGTTLAAPGTPSAGMTTPTGTYVGSGSGASPVGGGGLLSPDFALGSDYASGVTAPKPGGTGRFAGGGPLDYPEATGSLSVGGGGLLSAPAEPDVGLTTPSSRYGAGGDLDPFKQLGILPPGAGDRAPTPVPSVTSVPGGTNGIVPPGVPGSGVGPLDKYGQPAPPGHEFVRGPGGKLMMRALPEATSGSSSGPAEPDPGAGSDTAPSAPDTVLSGGGLLGVSPDLRAPIEANPLARVDAVLAQIRQRESGGNYAIPPERNVDFPRSHASGGYQFQPGTWRQWTAASGFGREYPEAYQAPPQVQDAVARYAALHGNVNAMNLWGASAGNRPYPSPYAEGGPPDEVIPSVGSSARPPVTLAQYAAPGAGGAPMPAAPGAPPTMPQTQAPPGADPAKFNALLLELARRNAAAEVLGMGNPYGSLLSVLQGSPQYKAAVEAATETARRGAGLPFVGPEAEAKARGGLEVDLITRGAQANLDRVTNQIKDMGAAALDPTTIQVRDAATGETVERQATRMQKALATSGFDVPELGIKGMYGPAPAGQIPGVALPGTAGTGAATRGTTQQTQLVVPGGPGSLADKPVLGPGEEAVIKGSADDIFKARTVAQDAAQSIETTKEARKLLDSGIFAGAGADKVTALAKIGNALNLTGTNTKETVSNTEAYFATVAGNVGRMIKQFGSGTGLSDADREYAAKMAAGQQTLDEASIRKILDINDRAGFNAINRHNTSVAGIRPGASLTPLTVPAPTPYQRTYPEGFVIENPQTGERQIRRNGNWEAMPR